MPERAESLRERAAEFRKIIRTLNSPEMRQTLEGMARQCERLADEIERTTDTGGEP